VKLLPLIAILLSACVTPGQQRHDALMRNSREFADNVRWARYEHATDNLPPDEARKFLKRVELIEEELVIADQEITAVEPDNSGYKARVLLWFEWYTKRDPIVRKTFLDQSWSFVEGRWLITEQRRTRGERFPLVLEKAESEEKTADDATTEPAADDAATSPPPRPPGPASP
jgi:hypothetical protein